MRSATRIVLSCLTVAVVVTSPAAAFGKPGTRSVHGKRTAATTIDSATGAATTTASGHISHIGGFTTQSTEQFIPTSLTAFGFFGAVTLTAENGDMLFGTLTGSGVNTSATTSMSTDTIRVTGGTGRFAGTGGTLMETINSTLVSVSPASQTFHDVATVQGTLTR